MKLYLTSFLLAVLTPINALAHSGGTDSNGCHAGSQPYHCHNSNSNSNSNNSDTSISVDAWDLNLGYQYQIEQTDFIPFAGASLGKSKEHENAKLGTNLGLKLQNGLYASYTTTSKSIQFGYMFFHISANPDYFGLGLRFPFNGIKSNHSSMYSSGSIFFSDDEQTN